MLRTPSSSGWRLQYRLSCRGVLDTAVLLSRDRPVPRVSLSRIGIENLTRNSFIKWGDFFLKFNQEKKNVSVHIVFGVWYNRTASHIHVFLTWIARYILRIKLMQIKRGRRSSWLFANLIYKKKSICPWVYIVIHNLQLHKNLVTDGDFLPNL